MLDYIYTTVYTVCSLRPAAARPSRGRAAVAMPMPLLLLLCAGLLPASTVGASLAAPGTIAISIDGPGASSGNPALGATVQLKVSCAAGACPPWVRIDRLDGVVDSTPYVRLVDEGYTFIWAPTFPHFFKPEWGIHTFPFGGSASKHMSCSRIWAQCALARFFWFIFRAAARARAGPGPRAGRGGVARALVPAPSPPRGRPATTASEAASVRAQQHPSTSKP